MTRRPRREPVETMNERERTIASEIARTICGDQPTDFVLAREAQIGLLGSKFAVYAPLNGAYAHRAFEITVTETQIGPPPKRRS